MMKKNSLILLSLIIVLMASFSLTRCGSGIGTLSTADASGMKY